TSAPFRIVAGAAAQIAVNAGNNQTQPAGTAVPVPPSVIVKDAKGNPVTGVAVTFAVAPGNGSITGASQTTNASGVATVGSWTLATAAREDTLTATASGLNGSPVIFTATGTAGGPDASQSLVSATPGTITASTGSSAATITVTVKDGFGNAVSGATVTLAASPTAGNTLTQPVGTTNASGQITGTLSSTAAGPKTVTATVNGTIVVTETATVTVNPAAVSASQSTVAATSPIAAGTGSSTITVTAKDALGNPIEGATVTLAASPSAGTTLTQPVGTTNASGVATGTLSSTAAGLKTVSAMIGSVAITQTATVTVTAGAAAAIASNSMNPQSATVGTEVGSPPSVIVRDASGNPVAGVAVTFAVTPGNGGVTGADQTTDASGIATVGSWTLSATAGPNALTATAAGSGISGNPVTFTAMGTAGAVSATQS